MAFLLRDINETVFPTIDFEAIGVPRHRAPPPKEWPCAVDEGRNLSFTQLISASLEMREGDYYYLLLVGKDPVQIHYRHYGGSLATILPSAIAQKYDRAYIAGLVNEAAVVCTYDRKPFRFE